MALDKLGATTVQKQGEQDSNRVFDSTNQKLLLDILKVLTCLKLMMMEMTDTEDER